MGMVGRMPLLTTLAALVIIVHSQEELDAEYQRDLTPRRLEPAHGEYEEEWRTVRSEPTAQQSVQAEQWEAPPTDPAPRRRRPGRKRKRRPVTALRESDERRFYHEEPPPYGNGEYPVEETTETPVKRRKRPEMQASSWVDAPHRQDRPIRRRGQRRHRLKGSKYDLYPPEERPRKPHKEYVSNDHASSNEEGVPKRQEATLIAEEDGEPLDKTNKMLEINQFEEKPREESLSIISGEQANVEKGVEDSTKLDQEANDTIDPATLREILKRSNGSSLSEILQQNNLSLTDLLHRKQNAISILKNEENIGNIQTTETQPSVSTTQVNEIFDIAVTTETNNNTIVSDEGKITNDTETAKMLLKSQEKLPKIAKRRRIKFDGRRRLRLRTPLLNMPSAKFQATRDFISPKFRKQLNENISMYSTPRTDILTEVASEINNDYTTVKEPEQSESTTISEVPESTPFTESIATTEDITTQSNLVDKEITTPNSDLHAKNDEIITTTDPVTTTTGISEVETEFVTSTTSTTTTTTGKPITSYKSIVRRPITNSELRRQALTNRMNKKRLRQKNLTTEPPFNKKEFDLDDFMVASEHFTKPKNTRIPNTKEESKLDDLPDLLENEASMHVEKSERVSSYTTLNRTLPPQPQPQYTSTTEEISKIEIEELLNDTDTGARISKILMERNMTLSELAEHRERGSSHVHLADIFHNTSKEPNPPEPFLSKSLIEPISKEIYPLRALLDANLHDPTNKLPTTDIYPPHEDANIPIVIDFKNNVNENGEKMGIASLFNKFDEVSNVPILNSEGIAYIATISHDNLTHESEKTREAKQLDELKENISLKDIFSMVQRNYHNQSMEIPQSLTKGVDTSHKTVSSAEDSDGDGLIVIEDLQTRLRDYDSQTSASGEKIDFDLTEEDVKPGILRGGPSKAKSVTVITASIVGLTMVVFLLTYAAFKCRQQRRQSNKEGLPERIPTPVYESRKSAKVRASNRSISPMLTNNIYTMSSMDSRNGQESPDYMWDSLRKPFQ